MCCEQSCILQQHIDDQRFVVTIGLQVNVRELALSTARFRRAGLLATADACTICLRYFA